MFIINPIKFVGLSFIILISRISSQREHVVLFLVLVFIRLVLHSKKWTLFELFIHMLISCFWKALQVCLTGFSLEQLLWSFDRELAREVFLVESLGRGMRVDRNSYINVPLLGGRTGLWGRSGGKQWHQNHLPHTCIHNAAHSLCYCDDLGVDTPGLSDVIP